MKKEDMLRTGYPQASGVKVDWDVGMGFEERIDSYEGRRDDLYGPHRQ